MNEEAKTAMSMSDMTDDAGEQAQGKLPITVKWGTLVDGLGILFAGVAKLLESIDPHMTHTIAEMAAAEREMKDMQNAMAVNERVGNSVSQTMVDERAAPQNKESTDDPNRTTVALDDIIRIIVHKVKQDRSNSDKIGSILRAYGVNRVSELHTEAYESFITEISNL